MVISSLKENVNYFNISNSLEIKGFWVTSYLWKKSLLQKYYMTSEIQKCLNTTLKTNVSARFDLKDIEKALTHYKSHMSEGKCVLKPFGVEEEEEKIQK